MNAKSAKAPVVRKEVLLPAPASRVWKALTDKEEMKKWYFNIESFEPVVGFSFRFYGEGEGKSWLHLCRITEVIEEKKLSYTWKYEGYGGESLVRFELFPEGLQTRLVLTHEGLETLGPGFPFGVESFTDGWNHIIGTSLREYLEKQSS